MRQKLGFTNVLSFWFLFGFVLSIVFTSRQLVQAQMQNPEETTNNSTPPSTTVPLGTQRGMDELRAVLEASEPTNAPPIRRVVISVPTEIPNHIRLQEAGTAAIRSFFLIADRESIMSNSSLDIAPDLEAPQGIRALLPNGGTIRLRVRRVNENNNTKAVGELRLQNHGIPGYERVNQIEFVTQ